MLFFSFWVKIRIFTINIFCWFGKERINLKSLQFLNLITFSYILNRKHKIEWDRYDRVRKQQLFYSIACSLWSHMARSIITSHLALRFALTSYSLHFIVLRYRMERIRANRSNKPLEILPSVWCNFNNLLKRKQSSKKTSISVSQALLEEF